MTCDCFIVKGPFNVNEKPLRVLGFQNCAVYHPPSLRIVFSIFETKEGRVYNKKDNLQNDWESLAMTYCLKQQLLGTLTDSLLQREWVPGSLVEGKRTLN